MGDQTPAARAEVVSAGSSAVHTVTWCPASARATALVSPMMPHLAEEAHAALGGKGLIAEAAWPVADPAKLVSDAVTLAIQVNGKLRDTLPAPKGLPPAVRDQLVNAVQKAVADPEFQAKAAGFFAPLRYLPPAAYGAELKEGEASFKQLWQVMPWGEK